MLVFEERENRSIWKKKLSEQRREPTTNSAHIMASECWDLNLGRTGGSRVLSPMHHRCCPHDSKVINFVFEGIIKILNKNNK